MLKIRLIRMGRRHRPFYRVVVVDSRRRRNSGAYIAVLGTYDPLAPKGKRFVLNQSAYQEWLSKGAQPSEAVLKLVLPIEEKKKLWPDKKPAAKGDDVQSEGEGEETSTTGDDANGEDTDKA